MKKLYNGLLFFAVVSCFISNQISAQCPGGYTQAQTNWDNLDYYYNSGSLVAPYGISFSTAGIYVTNAMEQTQRFGIGSTGFSIGTSAAGIVNGENAIHTGDLANYTGEDVQYTPSANGQTITITFATAVSGPNFTLYDIDANAVFTITATSNLGLPTTVNATGGSNLTIGILPLSRSITANGSSATNNSNNSSATVIVPGLVNSITITITTQGTDPVFWLSDINACTAGTLPVDYNKKGDHRPFVGPLGNQPDYFIITPDNNSVYMLDPATGQARHLFTEPSVTYVNTFAYDPVNRVLYYAIDGSASPSTNKTLKKYDFVSETSSIVLADISATLNIPLFDQGIESAAAAFYNGELYLGIEGGRFQNTSGGSAQYTTRESIAWKCVLNGSGVPTAAYQVAAFPGYNLPGPSTYSRTSIHDWGDFLVRNGVLVDFNTARNSTNYSQSKYHHFNLQTGNMDNVYNNPGTTTWNGQAGMGWTGNMYYFRATGTGTSGVGTYDGAGTNGAPVNITVVGGGPAWPGGAGDASENFRPKCDFGDAPASYDPYVDSTTQSPAVHERADNVWIGNTTVEATSWDREFLKKGVTGTNDTDNGLAFVPMMPQLAGSYLTQVSVYNNSGSNATLIAWLDYNANGVFDASEAATLVPAGPIASGAAVQTRYLYWPNYTTPLVNGQSTYLRIRITSSAMTASHATGYFPNGEVEDYRILVDNFPLATHLLNFDAALVNKKVKLNWKASEDQGSFEYIAERSTDNTNWTTVATLTANGINGTFVYEAEDPNPVKGVSYYRIRMVEATGMNRVSTVKAIIVKSLAVTLSLSPNPATDRTRIYIESNAGGDATIQLLSMQGAVILSKIQRTVPGQNSIEVLLPESISAGSYLVRVSLSGEIVNRKLVIKK